MNKTRSLSLGKELETRGGIELNEDYQENKATKITVDQRIERVKNGKQSSLLSSERNGATVEQM